MRKSEINFPHPLLSEYSKDYAADCSFEILLGEIKDNNNIFSFPFEYTLKSPGLTEMIYNNQAVVILKVYCSYTSYREVFVFKEGSPLTIDIPKGKVSKKLEIQGFVIATSDNSAFKLAEHNKEYFNDSVIEIKKGNILAEVDTIQITIDENELEKQFSSIIVVDCMSGIDSLDVNYNDDEDGLIHIRMPKDEYDEYFALRKNYKIFGISRFLQASVILPALTEAIQLLKTETKQIDMDPEFEEKYTTTIWADSILRKCDELNRDIRDDSISAYGLANEILHYVTKDAVSDLFKKAQEMYNNSGSTRIGGVD